MPTPVLSICIPTARRRYWLRKCLNATLAQVEALPPGLVEVVVSDNASPFITWPYIQRTAAKHPCMRIRRNEVDTYTENFIQVVQEATGRYVWLMGDDDAPLPGAVAKVLAEVQEHPRDLYVLHALETDLEDRPAERRAWFRDLPKQDWDLRDPAELKAYLDHAAYMAGVFGFISVLVFDRQAWLEGVTDGREFVSSGWPHVAMSLRLARGRGRVRVVPEPMLLNRVGNDGGAEVDLFGRIMHDLRGWVQLADWFFPHEPILRKAFMGVLRRNTRDGTLLALRVKAPSQEAWDEARNLLLSAYHSPLDVAQAELAYASLQQGRRAPSPVLDPGFMCFADLGFIARGARRTAVLVRDPQAAGTTRILTALHAGSRAQFRFYGPGDAPWAEDSGLQWRSLDLDRFVSDRASREPAMEDLRTFAPDLLVNLDPERHAGLDLLAAAARPAGAVAFPARVGALKPDVQAWLDSAYPWILSDNSPDTMLQALGLVPREPAAPAEAFEPAAPPTITSHAFLLELDERSDAWAEVLLAYLDAFQPGEPVLQILYLGGDRGGLTVDSVTRRVVELAVASGRQTFPDVVVVEDLVELGQLLMEFPVHSRLRPDRGDVTGLVGPFGQRFAISRRKLAALAGPRPEDPRTP